jgi:hypothetical protein
LLISLLDCSKDTAHVTSIFLSQDACIFVHRSSSGGGVLRVQRFTCNRASAGARAAAAAAIAATPAENAAVETAAESWAL